MEDTREAFKTFDAGDPQLPSRRGISYGRDGLSQCRRNSILVVGLMLICSYVAALLLRKTPPHVQNTIEDPFCLLAITLLVVVTIFQVQSEYPILCLTLITGWAALILYVNMPAGRKNVSRRALRIVLNVVALLLLAWGIGFFTDFYAEWSSILMYGLLALLITLCFFIVIPPDTSSIAPEVFSAIGSMLFAIWTVKDVRECPGGNATDAALYIFIDMINLITLS